MTQTNDLRILIIDDNPSIHQDFIKILAPKHSINDFNALDKELFGEASGEEKLSLPKFYIDTASQGQEGADLVKKALDRGEPYALAFVDVRMPPGLDGIETIKEIWKVAPDIQTVICTAFSDYSWEETIKQLGVTDNLLILKKPFDTVAVRQLACALTKKWQLVQAITKHTNLLETKVLERTSSLQNALSLTRATLDSSIDGIIVVNNEGKIIDFNNQYSEMWKIKDDLSEKDYDYCLNFMATQVEESEDFLIKTKELNKDPNQVSITSIRLKDGRVFERYSHPQKLKGKTVGRIWSFRDITERINLEGKLEFQATHDSLTELPNRILLRDRIQNAVCGASRKNDMVGILFFDLDRFKLVNDSLGHEAGDELLVAVSQRIKTIVRSSDTVARLGGDEFVLVVSDVENDRSIINVANKIKECFKEPFHIAHRDLFITASVGISTYPKDGVTVDELLRNADLAMYLAKNSGANQFHFYTDDLNQQAMVRLEKEEEMRNAILNKEFYLEYQPQFDVLSNTVVSVEALVRWKHPKKGIIVPLDFIPFAEESGLIVPLGEWVLRTACEQNKAWQSQGLPPIRIAINVATAQFKQSNFVQTVNDILKETGVNPENLEIEITENVLFSNNEISETINDLKRLGIQIALDDFGAGNSCLNYLKNINIDRLKIDQSFIQNISLDRSDEVIIQAIVNMAQSMNLEVLAEGVETQKQLDFIKSKSCKSVQGFFFGKPLAADELERLLKAPQAKA